MKNLVMSLAALLMFVLLACSPTAGVESTQAGHQEPASPPANDLIPRVDLVGEPEIVFDWTSQACEEETMPDLPVRPFRNAAGQINLNLSASVNHRMTGEDFDSLSVDCEPTLVSHMDPDPAAFDFSEWIGATYTEDGQTVYALIHNEYYGDIGSQWDSQRDFSGSAAENAWSYNAWIGGGYRPMNFDQAHDRWQGPRDLCQISAWGFHPDIGCEPALSWLSPVAGRVNVSGTVRDAAPDSGDGVMAIIFHETEQVWSQIIEPGDGEDYKFSIFIDVQPGDSLHFRVNARGDAGFDSTQFRVNIHPEREQCPSGDRSSCLMASLTWAVSTDGGAHFEHLPGPDHLLANPAYGYRPDWGTLNVWQPSNIVKNPHDGMYYALINWIWAPLDQPGHVNAACLMRTNDLSDPSSWRAWDGEGFNVSFVNPYKQADIDPKAHTCTPVSSQGLTYSLTYNTYFEKFIAVGHGQFDVPVNGFYYMLSDDLIHWSQRYLLMPAEFVYTTADSPYFAYPSLVDHNSPSNSFDITGQDVYLYYSYFNLRTFSDGDIYRVPVHFTTQ